MRKLLAVLFTVAATSSFAAWEKVGEMQVAGLDGLVSAAARFGELCTVPSLGEDARKGLYESDIVKWLGPTRDGAAVLVPVYVKSAKLAKPEELAKTLCEAFEFALIYPTVATKEKFLKHHADAVETNGFIVVDFDKSGKPDYVQFSSDGQWLVLSDKPEQVKLAMQDLESARRPLGGEVLRLALNAHGAEILRQVLKNLKKAADSELTPLQVMAFDYYLGLLDSVRSASIGVRIGDLGLDYRFSCKTTAGSELAKVGLKTLDKSALAFAGKDAVMASAKAEDSGTPWNTKAVWTALEGVLKGNGIDMDWVSCAEKPPAVSMTLDLTKATQWVMACVTNETFDLDEEKLVKEYETAMTQFLKPFSAKSPREAFALGIKGQSCTFTPAERYAATFPDLKDKPVYLAASGSVLAFLRMALPAVRKGLPTEQQLSVAPFLAMIPKDAAGGIALAGWREGDTQVGLVRISADEIKGFGTIALAVKSMFAGMMGGAADADDDSDDDDAEGDADDESDD